MADKPIGWPTHGHAVNARNDVAENLLTIMDELTALQKRAELGEVTRLDVALSINRIYAKASTSLALLIQQDAPIHPSRIMK